MKDNGLRINSSVPNLALWFYQIDRNSTLRVLSRKELEACFLTKALRDELYLEKLRGNAKKLIEDELGTYLPDNLLISVLEESENQVFLVIPASPYETLPDPTSETQQKVADKNAEWLLDDLRSTVLEKRNASEIIRRAWKNNDFLKRLKADPKSVIESECQVSLPTDLDVQVVCETRNQIYIVVPSLEKLPVYEWDIPENELDAVADASYIGTPGHSGTKAFPCTANPGQGCPGLLKLR